MTFSEQALAQIKAAARAETLRQKRETDALVKVINALASSYSELRKLEDEK